MKIRTPCAALALIATTAVITAAVVQEDPQAEMMKRWMEFMTPGEPHEDLLRRVGSWDMEVTMWMAPNMPPQTSRGHAEIQAVMGGRYIVEKTTGHFMGMPFEGMGVGGYDNMKKKHVVAWIDNMGTGLMVSEGTKEGNITTFEGLAPEVLSGKYVPMRSIETRVDDDTYRFEMHGPGPDGVQFKTMEIVYRRKAAGDGQ